MQEKWTALMEASHQGHYDVVDLLLLSKGDLGVDKQDYVSIVINAIANTCIVIIIKELFLLLSYAVA